VSLRTWGLDFGSTGIKAVELTRTWQGYRVVNYGFYPYGIAEREKSNREKLQILKKIFPGGSKEGKNVIVSLPSHRTMVHRVDLPFRERKKNRQVIKFEVEGLLPFSVDQVIVDFYQAQKAPHETQAMAFSARKEDLREYLSLMEEAGLDPECLVPEAMALFWLLPNLGKEFSSGALLDIGHEKTTMLVWHGAALTLVRSIPVAGSAMRLPAKEKLNNTLPEAPETEESVLPALTRLADEVQRTLMGYESHPGGRPLEKIYITGGITALPGLGKKIGEILRREVAVLDMGGSSKSLLKNVPEDYRHILAVALGSAFGGSVKEGDRINFRQEEFASPKKAKKAKIRITLLLSYGIMLAVLGMAAFAVDLYLKERRYQGLKADIRKEFMQAQPGAKKVVNEVEQMRNSVQEERARVNALGGFSKAASPLEILREFSTGIEPGWKVRVTDLVIEPEAIEISGEADSFETVNRVKSRLDKSSLYRDVQLKTARASTVENVVEFKLQMKRGI
jgi:Tfp pilus assembly PilM family ATPase/Tfp pilus assembly protein PilN